LLPRLLELLQLPKEIECVGMQLVLPRLLALLPRLLALLRLKKEIEYVRLQLVLPRLLALLQLPKEMGCV
jgi:hypothetical protein